MKPEKVVVFGITDSQSLILIAPLIREFQIREWSTSVITGGNREPRFAGITSTSIFHLRHLVRKPAPLRDSYAMCQIFVTILKERPTLVVFGTPKVSLIGMIAARMARVDRRAYIIRGSVLASSSWFAKPALWLAEALTCSLATTVIAVSKSLRHELVGSLVIAPNRCLVIGEGSSHGVNLTKFRSIRRHTEAPCNVGFVGRLAKDKGLDTLIEAFLTLQGVHPGAKLFLVGRNDGYMKKLRKIVAGNRGVVFRPEAQHGEELFDGFDILCLPSRREGFPNVALEAGALGIPVVASDVTGSRDAVLDGITGTLVPPNDPQSLARELRKLMIQPLLREELGKNARLRVERTFREDHVTSAYYAELINEPETSVTRKKW